MAIQSAFPRVTMYFQYGRKSWSESHYMVASGATAPAAIQTAWKPVLVKRSLLLAPGVIISGVKYGSDGQYRLFLLTGIFEPPENPNAEISVYNPAFATVNAADPNVAILLKADDPTDQYHKHTFIAGLPIGISGLDAPIDPVINTTWQQALNNYTKALQNGWGFRVKGVGSDAPQFLIQSIAFANGSMTVTLQPGQAGTIPAANTQVTVGKVILTTGQSVNGKWLCTATTSGAIQTLTLQVPQALATWVAQLNTGFVRSAINGVVPYGSFSPSVVVTRKRGVGYDPPRGRSRPKARSH